MKITSSYDSSLLPQEALHNFATKLIAWQKKFGRHHLPWQNTNDPYHVWLSEIMLQQTQVTTVLQYYSRFTKHFPTIQALAHAHIDEVLSLWSGLGYYTRARNLHKCAQIVSHDYNGHFPSSFEGLLALPGIGRSTAAAIAAFCFNQPVSIFDGNVKRVLTRVLAYGQDVSTTAADKELWHIAQTLIPSTPSNMPAYTQGLMDLGATLCLPKQANCDICPQKDICHAHQQKNELSYPYKTKKLKRSTKAGFLLWLTSPDGIWLVKRENKGIWGGLYCMPLFDEYSVLKEEIASLNVQDVQELPTFKHVLTHMDWMLKPIAVEVDVQQAKHLPDNLLKLEGKWFSPEASLSLGLPAPIKALIEGSTALAS